MTPNLSMNEIAEEPKKKSESEQKKVSHSTFIGYTMF